MVEVTESDRRAVRAFQEASVRYMHRALTDVSFGSALGEQQDDTHPIYQAFARHREQAAAEERAKIVAWLRGFATNYADDLADILEAGEHEDFTHPDNV